MAGCCALLGLATAAHAQTVLDGQWHGDISVGGSSASGNSSANTLNMRADGIRATALDQISLYALINYGSSTTNGVKTRSADLVRLGGRYDRNINEILFAFGGGELEVNKPGGVKSRQTVNLGGGWHIVRRPETTWDLFAGVGATATKFTDGSSRNGPELLVGEESSHKLGMSTTFKQRLAVYPGSSEVGNRATFDAGLATAIVGGWTFNAGLGLRYTSKVAPGLSKNERLLTFGFGYKF